MAFRIPRWAVAGLQGEELAWAVIEPMWNQLRTPYEPDPRLQQATAGQRALYALHWLWSEVNNGGFHQYFWNPTGMLADQALQGARRLGAAAYAELVAEAITTVFGGADVPQDQSSRRRALEEMTSEQRHRLDAVDRRFCALLEEQPLGALLEHYVDAHPSEFFLDDHEEDPATSAQGRLNLAHRLVTRNQPGDLERARPLLEQAQAKARALGLAGIEGRCQSLLDQLDFLRWS
jgi:hypothetical protein